MSACIYCGGLCLDPHDVEQCEKCERAKCRDGYVPPVEADHDEGEWMKCKCECHMSMAELEAIASDRLLDEWEDMQDRGKG